MNDLDYYESHGFSRDEARSQVAADRASTALMMLLFRFFFNTLLFVFLFLPGIFCAYLLLHAFRNTIGNPKGWNYIAWMAGTVYLLECIVFFLKGLYVSLKENGSKIWMALYVICFLYCMAFPVLMVQEMIADQFRRTPGHHDNSVIISWLGAAILGYIIYRRYGLGSDEAPRAMSWAYRFGRHVAS